MGTCMNRTNLILSAINVFFGLSACIVFLFVYHNVPAGIWTILTAVFAACCFHLHRLNWTRQMADYYTAQALFNLRDLGIVTLWISIGFFSWYIFSTIYWHIPMVPIEDSRVIPAVWCFMTGKWAFHLSYYAKQYARLVLLSGYDPIPTISA